MSEEIINKEIERVNRAMSQEGMPLTEEDKQNLKEVITGQKTYDEKVKEIINKTNTEPKEEDGYEVRKL